MIGGDGPAEEEDCFLHCPVAVRLYSTPDAVLYCPSAEVSTTIGGVGTTAEFRRIRCALATASVLNFFSGGSDIITTVKKIIHNNLKILPRIIEL